MPLRESLSPGRLKRRRAILAACLGVFGLALAGTAFAQQTADYTVAGRSMVPTLMPGDRIVVVAEAYADHPPGRGELVAIRFKSRPRPMVKRVIAIAGDSVEIRAGRLWLNGRRLEEPYLADPRVVSARDYRLLLTQLARGGGTVPLGHVVVMGDNVRGSFDSGDYGLVSLRQVVGRVLPATDVEP